MAEKRFQTRMLQKHDIEVNWLRATAFVPLKGEIIVYDIEVDADGNTLALPDGRTTPYRHARMKIGDGISYLKDLPFAVGESNDSVGTSIQIITWGDDD